MKTTWVVDSLVFETNRMDSLFGRSKLDLTDVVWKATKVAELRLSARRCYCWFHRQRIGSWTSSQRLWEQLSIRESFTLTRRYRETLEDRNIGYNLQSNWCVMNEERFIYLPGTFNWRVARVPGKLGSAAWICLTTVSRTLPDGSPPTLTINGLPVPFKNKRTEFIT